MIVRKFLAYKENWRVPENESDWWNFLQRKRTMHILYRKVYPSCPKNLYFLWADIQLSKGKVNNYKTKVTIDGKDASVMYRSASCNGVKACSENGCPYEESTDHAITTQANPSTRPMNGSFVQSNLHMFTCTQRILVITTGGY